MARTPAARRWSALIEKHDASGLTIKAFAAQNNVNAGTLAWWRSELKRKRTRNPGAFVELKVADKLAPEPQLEDRTVVLALDDIVAHVVVDEDTDIDLLKRVLSALC